MADNYKVLVPELSVPRSIGALRDIYGNEVGHSHVNETYYEGDVLAEEQVSPVVREAVERGELDGRLEKVSDEPGLQLDARLREAAGYSDLDVDTVRGLFGVLPSEAIQAIKEYEAEYGQNRPEIVEYDIGRGEAYVDRALGQRVSSDLDDADEKPVSDITTREVGESDFRFGEGYTGDGQPDREFGSTEADEGEVAKASSAPEADSKDSESSRPRARRSASKDENSDDGDEDKSKE